MRKKAGRFPDPLEFLVEMMGIARARFAAPHAPLAHAPQRVRSHGTPRNKKAGRFPDPLEFLVEMMGIEPTTSALRTPRSPN